jgi:hypothetical protein
MSCEVSPKAKQIGQRYMRGMAIAAVLYMAVVAGGVYVINNNEPPQWLVIALALAPLAPAALMLRTYLVFFRALDEFQRRIQTEAMLITLGVVGLGAFTYGFLEEWADFPHVPLIWVFPAIIVTWTFAQIFVRVRYK